ncbi:MAG: hypothetical protein JRN62_06035 [Nitrososphaerota archaeon]|nr:hypothetical protein [Nitrososphaerota archaeon]
MAKVPITTRWRAVKEVIHCNMDGDRSPEQWRRDAISLFFNEKRKTGDYHYAYEVERMADGSAIFLLRPTWKRGLDYLVVYKDGAGSLLGPRFEEVDVDLAAKAKAEPELFESLAQAATAVHRGEDPVRVLGGLPNVARHNWKGLPAENLLKIMKWLFIDEDIKYWAFEGRDKWKWYGSHSRLDDHRA